MSELTAVDRLPILLVDDVPGNLRTLESVLEPLGFPLRTASSGREALRELLEHDFALILLDVRMPGLDGLETARLIKGRARTRDVPIVFLTSARDEVGDIIEGYGIGALDYVLKPFDPELLRSKVAVFAELESSRRALKRSEALLRGAFEAAPIGKTMLDAERAIIRANPAFARLVGYEPRELRDVPIVRLCDRRDRETLTATLDRLAEDSGEEVAVDLRLQTHSGAEVWVALVASSIEQSDLREPLLLVQWVDLTTRRRAEQARAELLLEQAARAQAEAITARLEKLQALSAAIESLPLYELLDELALRLAALFEAEAAEVQISGQQPKLSGERIEQAPMTIARSSVGVVRLQLPEGRSLSAADRSLLRDAAERVALGVRRAQLHEEEHRIAVELQRGLLPKSFPSVAGVELAAHYEAAGLGAEVGGDWYDAFALPGGRLGIVLGDVAGRSIPAASAMGQLRTVTRAFALTDDGRQAPGDVLTHLNRYQLALAEGELFTVVYAVIDPAAGTLAWANAGHPPPLLRRAPRDSAYLEGGGGLMGIEDVVYETHDAALGRGTALVLYTDGLVERRGESLDTGLARLRRAVSSGPEQPQALCAHIVELVRAGGDRAGGDPDHERDDDVTALVARVA